MAESQPKQCRKCGQVKPVEAFPKNRRECRACVKVRQRAWEAANRGRVNQLHRDWKAANPEQSHAIKRRWYEANRESILNRRKVEYEANAELLKAKGRAAYRKNLIASRARSRAWAKANPLKTKVHWKNAKARRRRLPNTWTISQARKALAYWGDACATCRTPFGLIAVCHWDHWVPLIHPNCPGTVAGNMVPLCDNCNLTKNARDAVAWLKERFGNKADEIVSRVADYLSGAHEKKA
jgi:hypothetical protein